MEAGEVEVQREQNSALTNRVMQKKKDNFVKYGPDTSRRDKFEITNMSIQEASARFRTSERTQEENPEDSLCFICFTNEPNAVFLDCGHGGVCLTCSIDAMKKNNSCTICRQVVVQILEIESLQNTEGLFKVLNSFYVSAFHKKQTN